LIGTFTAKDIVMIKVKASELTYSSQMFVQTKYIGPTDHRGARVKAKNMASGKSVTISWDHGLSVFENHAMAARALYEKLGIFTGQPAPVQFLSSDTKDSSGYILTAAKR
jgi:hypothetical protein